MTEHGTYSRYVDARCRCIPCREANNAYHRAYRAVSDKPRQAVARYQQLHRKQRAVAERARRLRIAQQDIPQRALRAIS